MKNQYVSPLTEDVQLDALMVTFGDALAVSIHSDEYNGGGL